MPYFGDENDDRYKMCH